MRFRFNERKTAQAAAYLLKCHGGRLNYMKLLKLLYLADRSILIDRGRTLSGDHMVSMPHGPVLSMVYDRINLGSVFPVPWSEYVSEPTNYEVSLAVENPDFGQLSRYEMRILDEIDERYGAMDKWNLVQLTHQLPEWEDPHGSSRPIEPETILRDAGYSSEEIRGFVENAEELFFIDALSGPEPYPESKRAVG